MNELILTYELLRAQRGQQSVKRQILPLPFAMTVQNGEETESRGLFQACLLKKYFFKFYHS